VPTLDLGPNRIIYKATKFRTGRTVTAYLWSPSLVKSDLQTFTEIEQGLYYLDYDFGTAGAWPLIIYEDGTKKGFAVIRIETVEGTMTLPKVLRILLAALSGKLSGGGTTTVKFRDLADSKDRIEATVDAYGNRTAIELDAD